MGAGAGQSARSQNQTQALEVDRAAAEAELEVARPAEGAVHRVVGIDADATVEVLGGVGQLAGTVIASFGLGIASKFLEGWTGAVIAKILVLVFIIVFIQRRPQGLFALKGRQVDA